MLSASDPTGFLAPHGNTSNADSKRIVSGCFKALSPHFEVFPLFPSFLASNAEAVLGSVTRISVRDQGAAITHAQCQMGFTPQIICFPQGVKLLHLPRSFSSWDTALALQVLTSPLFVLLSNLPLIFEIIVCYLVAMARVSTDYANWIKAVRFWKTEVLSWEDCLCLRCHCNLLSFWSLDPTPLTTRLWPCPSLFPSSPLGNSATSPERGELWGNVSLCG